MNIAIDDTDFSDLTVDAATGTDPTSARPLSKMLSDRLQSATDITTNYFAEAATKGEDEVTATIKDLVYKKTVTCTGAGQPTEAGDKCTAANVGQDVEIDATVAAPTSTTWRVYSFADGTAFAYDIAAADCDAIKNNCVGFIDVNGSTGPNTPIDCGTNAANGTCEPADITDIYPVSVKQLNLQTIQQEQFYLVSNLLNKKKGAQAPFFCFPPTLTLPPSLRSGNRVAQLVPRWFALQNSG